MEKLTEIELEDLTEKIISSYDVTWPYILKYRVEFKNLLKEILNHSKNYEDFQGPPRYRSDKEVKFLNHEFFKKISREYGQKFLKDFKDEKINLNGKEDVFFYWYNSDQYDISIEDNENLFKAFALCHEYTHRLSYYQPKIKSHSYFYWETVSILSEMLFQDYLLEKGFSSFEILIDTRERLESMITRSTSFIFFNECNNLLEQERKITNYEIKRIIEQEELDPDLVEKIIEKSLEGEINITDDITHTYHALLAFKLYHDNISKEEFKNLIDNIGKSTIQSFEKLMNLPLKETLVDGKQDLLNSFEEIALPAKRSKQLIKKIKA